MSAQATNRQRIVVVGGGINGLSAAYAAWFASGEGDADICVLEAAPRVGGKARTRRADGWLLEEGPTGFLSGEPTLDRLIELAGLEAIPARAEAERRYVVHAGKAREISSNPLAFARSGLLSISGLLRMAREPFIPRWNGTDESIWDFAERRLGKQVAERLIAPMVLGVFAGDARKLSLPSAFPRMAELEAEYGSLIRAMLRLMGSKKKHGGPSGPAGVLHSFAEGMESLPRGLAERAPFEVRCNAGLQELQYDTLKSQWRLRVSGAAEWLAADQVILSCDPHRSAELLAEQAPATSAELAALTVPAVTVLGLSYPRSTSFPVGFGALIPRGEGFRALGCLFDSQLFDGRSPEQRVLVRCMLGGATDPELAGLPDDELLRVVSEDLARLFGIHETPELQGCVRHSEAIPQYEVGHAARLERIDAGLAAVDASARGLHLAGCFRAGVAFGKTAKDGWRMGELAGKSAQLVH